MEEDESVTQGRDGDAGQLAVLHRDVGGEAAGVDRLAGGPREAVRRPARHPVDLLPYRQRRQKY